MKRLLRYLFFVLLASLSAISYTLFVFPNQFAPAGFNGIATMIQHLFGINVGYLSLIFNVPLIIAVFILVDKDFALNTMVFVLTFSGALIVLEKIDLSWIIYQTENGTSTILGPVVAGILGGGILGLAFMWNGCSGGTELVAALIHKYKPAYDFVWVSFILNAVVAVMSFFVFGFNFEPVILCIIYCYASSVVSDKMLKGTKEAVRFEVITNHPNDIVSDVIEKLGHAVTIINAEGGYTHQQKKLLICVVNKHQIVQFKQILSKYPETFACVSNVNYTIGRFKYPRETNSTVS